MRNALEYQDCVSSTVVSGSMDFSQCKIITGELPITLIRPDRSIIQQQKTPVSNFGLTFYRPMLERFYRRGVPTPLSIQFFYSPTMERTSVELFDCSIRPDRLTGSSPLYSRGRMPNCSFLSDTRNSAVRIVLPPSPVTSLSDKNDHTYPPPLAAPPCI
jgi:hypothetical protein